MQHYLSHIDPLTKRIISTCYPKYTGRKVRISTNIPERLDSYWDEGSIRYYSFYQLSTGKCQDVHSNHPFFEKNQPSVLKSLPRDIIIVMHQIFCGKDMGITIYANQEDLTPLLPSGYDSELTREEKIVLIATRSYKSSYAGVSNYRFYEANRQTGITSVQWETAKSNLINKGLLDKRGSITANGRNIAGWKQLHQI